MTKLPIDIDVMMARIAEAVEPLPKAALFELADDGFDSPFEQLVACIISIRTLDEVTLVVARRLFDLARTPEEMALLSPEEIDQQIHDCSFHEQKARQIRAIALTTVRELGGQVPCDDEILRSFAGVGPKCANLTLAIGCHEPRISVDVHVHRVTNRWGYVATSTPEETLLVLEAKLPRRYWIDINRQLVPFGKHICTGRLPRCTSCPVLAWCRQVGVTGHR